MLLRVYVDSRADFDAWVHAQAAPAIASASDSTSEAGDGRKIFESTSCINCHAVKGTIADGRFGPDLTHLMSRKTIASGAADNTPANLKKWVRQSRLDQARLADARDAID